MDRVYPVRTGAGDIVNNFFLTITKKPGKSKGKALRPGLKTRGGLFLKKNLRQLPKQGKI
jgi:hypothetical protein